MITRKVRIQLTVFSMLTLMAFGLIFFHYAKVPSLLGYGQVSASAVFDRGAGIYPQANVTYRGVTVGKVTDVDLSGDGVHVTFRVASDADVPVDVTASIRSISAIGEQYVDLVPRSSDATPMAEGDVIPIEHTQVPVPIATVLDDANRLVASVPLDDLNTTLTEADLAFSDLGPELDSLTRNAQLLLEAADDNYDETSQLLKDGDLFLDDQLSSSAAIRAWTKDLRGFSGTVRRADPRLRALLRDLPPAAEQIRLTVDQLGEDVPPLLDSGQVVVDLLADYHDPLEQVLVYYPRVIMTNIATTSVHDGAQRMAFKAAANYPGGGCNTGFPAVGDPLGPRPPEVLTDLAAPPGAYCKVPQDDQRITRGARNLECFEPGSPPGKRAATIYQCRGDKDPDISAAGPSGTGTGTQDVDALGATGAVGDILAYLGGKALPALKEDSTWHALLMVPST